MQSPHPVTKEGTVMVKQASVFTGARIKDLDLRVLKDLDRGLFTGPMLNFPTSRILIQTQSKVRFQYIKDNEVSFVVAVH